MKAKLILYAVTIPICWRNCVANNHPHYCRVFRRRNIFTVQFLNCHMQHKGWFLQRVTLSKVSSSGEENLISELLTLESDCRINLQPFKIKVHL